MHKASTSNSPVISFGALFCRVLREFPLRLSIIMPQLALMQRSGMWITFCWPNIERTTLTDRSFFVSTRRWKRYNHPSAAILPSDFLLLAFSRPGNMRFERCAAFVCAEGNELSQFTDAVVRGSTPPFSRHSAAVPAMRSTNEHPQSPWKGWASRGS